MIKKLNGSFLYGLRQSQCDWETHFRKGYQEHWTFATVFEPMHVYIHTARARSTLC